jgi:hypothetical protein
MALPTSSSSTGLGSGAVAASGTLKYPKDMIYNGTDYVRFDFYKYSSGTPFGSATTGATGLDAATVDSYNSSYNNLERDTELNSVILYMPEDVGAEYSTSWGGKSFSNIGAAVLRSVGNLANGNVGGAAANIAGQLEAQVKGFAAPLIADKIAEGLNKVPGVGGGISINDVLGGTKGVVLNPNAELMFDRAEMRNFGLSFKMVPRNANESIDIKNIITTFKKAAAPGYGGSVGGPSSANFMSIPALIDVNFMRGSSHNEYVSQYKPCALTSVRVNFTPDGVYSTYHTGAPVAVTLDLSFSETKIVFRNDIKDSGWSY